MTWFCPVVASKVGLDTDVRVQEALRQQLHVPPQVQQQQMQQQHPSIAAAFQQRKMSTPYASVNPQLPVVR